MKKTQETMKFASAGPGTAGGIDCQLFSCRNRGEGRLTCPIAAADRRCRTSIAGRVDYICTLPRLGLAPGRRQDRQSHRRADQGSRAHVPNVKSSARAGSHKRSEASTWFSFMRREARRSRSSSGCADAIVAAMEDPERCRSRCSIPAPSSSRRIGARLNI